MKANAIPPQPDETFFPSARTKSVLSAVLSNDQTKKHAIVSAVATARAEIAPTSAHALDVESLKVTGANGHGEYAARCPVSGAKRTSFTGEISAAIDRRNVRMIRARG